MTSRTRKKMDNILIVDDDKYMCKSLSYLLKEEGYNVNTAYDGADALSKLKKSKPDVIVIDYNLSGLNGMTGLSVLEKVNEMDPSIRSIMISAYGDERIKHKAKDIGVDGFLDKPFKLTRLIRTIGNSITKKRKKSANTKQKELREMFRKAGESADIKQQKRKESSI